MKRPAILLPGQCKMARKITGLTVGDVATIAKVARETVARFERGENLKPSTVAILRQALEDAGVEFTNGRRSDVRLKAKPKGSLARG